MKHPKVSVCMITYNHEAYITQAIEGISMQDYEGAIELVIADDASTDRTRAIVLDHKELPGNIQLKFTHHEVNLGMYKNFMFALQQCTGEYIAFCEGDDYWTDPAKITKQVNFMQDHPEFEICFTNVNVIDSKGTITKPALIQNAKNSIYTHQDMPIWSPTLTRLFKNRDFSTVLEDSPGMDTLMLVYQSTLGKIKYIDEITGTYRVHDSGVYSSKDAIQKKVHMIHTLQTCLSVVENDMLTSFFGLQLKHLLDLKLLSKDAYSKSREELNVSIHRYRKELGKKNHVIVKTLLRSQQFVKSNEQSKSWVWHKKVINRLLIYKNR